MATLLDALQNNQWLAVEALVLGLVLRLLKDDSRFPTLPSRWRAFAALSLGAAVGAINQRVSGLPWPQAILAGMGVGGVAIVGHDTVIEGILGGKEIPLPKVLRSGHMKAGEPVEVSPISETDVE